MFHSNVKVILSEMDRVLGTVQPEELEKFIHQIFKAHTIIGCGAGRVGMMTRAFIMRLGHLGLKAYMLGDATVPAIASGDLLLVCSGSGETQTIYDLAVLGKKAGASIALVTGNPTSRIGLIADTLVQLKAPSKTKAVEGFSSIQPMTTLNEQCLLIFFDALVLSLMKQMNETHKTLWARHSILE